MQPQLRVLITAHTIRREILFWDRQQWSIIILQVSLVPGFISIRYFIFSLKLNLYNICISCGFKWTSKYKSEYGQSTFRIVALVVNLSCISLFFSFQENLNSETIQEQFKITKKKTNTSQVMEWGDKVLYIVYLLWLHYRNEHYYY